MHVIIIAFCRNLYYNMPSFLKRKSLERRAYYNAENNFKICYFYIPINFTYNRNNRKPQKIASPHE